MRKILWINKKSPEVDLWAAAHRLRKTVKDHKSIQHNKILLKSTKSKSQGYNFNNNKLLVTVSES